MSGINVESQLEQSPRFWQRELCPKWDRYFDWLRQPLGWVVALGLFSILVGLLVGQQGWIVFGLCVAVVLMGICWPWLPSRFVTANLEWSRRSVIEGDELEAILRVHNPLPIPIWGFRIHGMSQFGGIRSLSCVSPWGTSEFRWTVSAGFRGSYPAESLVLSNGFPFGLVECEVAVVHEDELVVWPRLVEARIALGQGMADPQRSNGHQIKSVVGQLRGLRSYYPGDSMKQCHWPKTARTGELVVRENEETVSQDFHFWLEVLPNTDQDPFHLELMLRATLAVMSVLNRSGTATRLTIGNQSWEVPGNRVGWKRFMSRMAVWNWEEDLKAGSMVPGTGRILRPRVVPIPTQREKFSAGRSHSHVKPWVPKDWMSHRTHDLVAVSFEDSSVASSNSRSLAKPRVGHRELHCA